MRSLARFAARIGLGRLWLSLAATASLLAAWIATPASPLASADRWAVLIVEPGESVEGAALRGGADASGARAADGLLKSAWATGAIGPRDVIHVETVAVAGLGPRLAALRIDGVDGRAFVVERFYDGSLRMGGGPDDEAAEATAPESGRTTFFDTAEPFLRAPIADARITSGFGMRRHPILGYGRMHQGVDFAASLGTPVLAAADGVIVDARPWAGYGNWLRIRHAEGWQTGYAHLAAFAGGVTPGVHVRQGQIVGYVGQTGLATGPHLHYEVWRNGVRIDPTAVALAETGRDVLVPARGPRREDLRLSRL